ncbi:hypothetical protein KC19_6G103400 [Ceratodon purpureus]|uniref:F-box domain-containing protein n=1 Tax=Ceratodon purpureus TaxID=3225 RepID=A0A8T0HG71_CERPU|nr:hypothetical protein KC19_6G103400 [Ceratodon purpureus]KAG0569628.1 hypothetical protein KC19_6G103400 [Ceratodon purpureus]KAG0569629.1 hypothetical protein KC19_6G103400 [Ceratodon purpureus]
MDPNGYMDPELWGNLQCEIPLDLIFAKLPLREFFQLRVVCREWNRLASDREFLVAANPKPIQKLYFHLCRRGPDYQLHGLLTYTSWCKRWDYSCLGQHDELYSLVANQGLIYAPRAGDCNILRVFDIHSRIWYTLPRLDPELRILYDDKHFPVVALKVDTSSYPYEFEVIRAGGISPSPTPIISPSPTHIYNSRTNTWSVGKLTNIVDSPIKATCAQVSDALYVWSDLDYVYCYKITEDCWYTRDVAEDDDSFESWLTGIGAWKEKVYHVSSIRFGKYPNSWDELLMYEWDDEDLQWEEVDRMPPHLRDWLLDSCNDEHYAFEILSSHCDEWVLIYSYYYEVGNVNKYILYNLETKVWEIANIPDALVQPFLDDEETEFFYEPEHCYHRKKSRAWASMQATYRSHCDRDDEQQQVVQEKQPASLDDWSHFLDQL